MLRKDDENLIIMHYKKGALGFLVLSIFKNVFSVFVPKNRFWCSLRFTDFPYFSIWLRFSRKILTGLRF